MLQVVLLLRAPGANAPPPRHHPAEVEREDCLVIRELVHKTPTVPWCEPILPPGQGLGCMTSGSQWSAVIKRQPWGPADRMPCQQPPPSPLPPPPLGRPSLTSEQSQACAMVGVRLDVVAVHSPRAMEGILRAQGQACGRCALVAGRAAFLCRH